MSSAHSLALVCLVRYFFLDLVKVLYQSRENETLGKEIVWHIIVRKDRGWVGLWFLGAFKGTWMVAMG